MVSLPESPPCSQDTSSICWLIGLDLICIPMLTTDPELQVLIHTHAQSKETLTRTERKLEFNESGLPVSIQVQGPFLQAYWPIPSYLRMDNFIPLSFYFPHLLLPKSPKSSPSPTFGSFSKHLIKNPVQSPNALSPHRIMLSTSFGSKCP